MSCSYALGRGFNDGNEQSGGCRHRWIGKSWPSEHKLGTAGQDQGRGVMTTGMGGAGMSRKTLSRARAS